MSQQPTISDSDSRPRQAPKECELVELVMSDFMTEIASVSLADFPQVRRWDDTDDIRQTAAERLIKAIRKAKPDSIEHVRSLAARHIRFTLLSHARTLKRQSGGMFITPVATPAGFLHLEEVQPDDCTPTCDFEPWERLHQAIADLPDDEQEVFELMWYHGFKSGEVAKRLKLKRFKVQRLYSNARSRLLPFLKDVQEHLH